MKYLESSSLIWLSELLIFDFSFFGIKIFNFSNMISESFKKKNVINIIVNIYIAFMYDSIHVSFHSSTSSTYDGHKNLDSYQQKVPLSTIRATLMHKIQ